MLVTCDAGFLTERCFLRHLHEPETAGGEHHEESDGADG